MAAWFVSHCGAPSGRDQLTKKLQEFIGVDIFGACGNLSCPHGSNVCDEMLNTTYRFYFAFENSLCTNYLSEKSFVRINYNVVPVIYSGADLSRFFPPHSYIDVNAFATAEDLANRLKFLADHPEEYVKYFWWKKYYRVEPATYRDLEKACKKLNEIKKNPTTHVYGDIKAWFNGCSDRKINF
jgi:alpha-1,3-fucosyltransferase